MRVKGTQAVAALIAVSFMGSLLVTPLYTRYAAAFHFSETLLTLVYSVYVVGNLGALLFFGKFSDAIGRRRVAIPAILVGCISALTFLFARDITWLFVARALSGFAIGLASGTAAAWLVDLLGEDQRKLAAIVTSAANMTGAAIGPVYTATIIEVVPKNALTAPFVVYLALLVVVGIALVFVPDTVQPQAIHFRELVRPRVGVPREIRAAFFVPAAAAFGVFAFVGFYAALIPTVLSTDVHQSSTVLGALVVSGLFATMTLTIILARNIDDRKATLISLALLIPGVALLLWAQIAGSMPLVVLATIVGGIAGGIGFRGTLQVVNEIAPEHRRAEVISAYYVVMFMGNAVPVIGVGIMTDLFNSMTASIAFGCTIAIFALAALAASPRVMVRREA